MNMMKKYTFIATLPVLCFLTIGCHRPHKFARMAEETNKHCPMRLNETVTLDSTVYDEAQNRVSYFYSVNGELDDADYMRTHRATFHQTLKDAVDNSIEMEEYRRAHSSIRYVYSSSTQKGKTLAEFTF